MYPIDIDSTLDMLIELENKHESELTKQDRDLIRDLALHLDQLLLSNKN